MNQTDPILDLASVAVLVGFLFMIGLLFELNQIEDRNQVLPSA